MGTIYTPKGKAREYSPLALNIYLACSHNCRYCYAPNVRRQSAEQYFTTPSPRRGIADKLKMELDRYGSPKEQVLLSFIGDVYCEATDGNQATRECLEVLLDHKVPVAILTKGGSRCMKDLDLFERFGEHIQIGTTLTFDNDRDSTEWEPGAALPDDRMRTLRTLHEHGVRTFASFEPVIDPEQSLALMEQGLDCIDVYKIGKLNNYMGLDKAVDWTGFLERALGLLRENGKQIYVKHDLRQAAPSIRLYGNECLPDEHNVK